MSPSSTQAQGTATLTIDGGKSYVNIEVLDGALNPVAIPHNVGTVTAKLKPGAYAVRFRVGDEMQERLVMLQQAGDEERIALDWSHEKESVLYSSPAPLPKTSTTREYHQAAAVAASRSAPTSVKGAEGDAHLLVFARSLEQSSANPIGDLALCDLNGKVLTNLAAESEHQKASNSADVHLAIAPGAYRLRVRRSGRSVSEQIIYVAAGWQTQLFLLADERRGGRKPLANTRNMSVLLAKPDRGFDHENPELQTADAALQALQRGTLITGKKQNEMLRSKWENPMLGIFCSLLHLKKSEPDFELMRRVFERLLRLTGPHPDVLAIGWGIVNRTRASKIRSRVRKQLAEAMPMQYPPMLAESWDLLIEANASAPELFARHSLAVEVGGAKRIRSAWLIWDAGSLESARTTVAAAKAEAQPERHLVPPEHRKGGLFAGLMKKATAFLGETIGIPVLKSSLQLLSRQLTARAETAYLLDTNRFTDVERLLARYVQPMADPRLVSMTKRSPKTKKNLAKTMKPRTDPKQLLQELEMPLGTSIGICASLLSKIDYKGLIPGKKHLSRFVSSEAQSNAFLSRTLKGLATEDSGIEHKASAIRLNDLEFLYLRYRGSPSVKNGGAPSATELASLLTRNGYRHTDGDKLSSQSLGQELGRIREYVRGKISRSTSMRRLGLPKTWGKGALPPPSRYKPGKLFRPLPATKGSSKN